MAEPSTPVVSACANCGARLAGEYCAACGQRHEPHVHSVRHFAAEAIESISHADSRLWRTIGYLLWRPGFLTREFFAGHRARYLPPFRLYLVLSVIFFLVGGLPGTTPDNGAVDGAGVAAPIGTAQDGKLNVRVQGLDEFCSAFNEPETGGAGRQSRDNIRDFCQRVQTDNGALGEELLRNLPRAMFIFLPVLALLMKLLYWRPKRFYVEHLLFLVHNHAFVFLLFTLLALISLALQYAFNLRTSWLYGAGFLYMVLYIYRGMSHYYEQAPPFTVIKYLILAFSYLSLSGVVLLTTLLVSAILG